MAESKDRRIAFGLFVVVLVTYGYFYGGGGWNQNAQFSLTRAMVEDGTFAIDRFASTTGDVSRSEGRLFANKSPGVSFLAAIAYTPIYFLETSVGMDPSAPLAASLNLYLCTFLVSGVSGAGLIAFFFNFVRRDLGTPRRRAAAVALLLAFGTPVLAFATVLFAHVASALFLFVACAQAFRNSRGSSAVAGGAAGLAALTNYLAVPLLPILAGIAVARRGWRAGAAFSAAALPGLLLLGWYQKVAFGGWLRTPVETMDARFVSEGFLFGIIRLPAAEAFWGITFSPYRGLLFISPILLLSAAGAWAWWRSRRDRMLLIVSCSIVTWFLGFNASFNGWEAGFSFGPRYLIAAVPFLALLLVRAPLRAVVAVPLAVVSIANCFAAAAVDPQPSGSIPRPLTQYIYPLLLKGEFSSAVPLTPPWSSQTIRGHVAVNPHTPDQLKPFLLHPPDSAESQWASFNLGEPFFGAGSPWSLLPVVLWMIGGALWLWREARGDPEGSLATGMLVV